MKLFIVNNTYHIKKVEYYSINAGIDLDEIAFISVSHNIDQEYIGKYKVFNIPRLIERVFDYVNLVKFFKVKREIKKIDFSLFTELYVFTEYELVNCAIIKEFKKTSGPVNLIEDNGMSSYIQFKIKYEECGFLNRYIIAKIFLGLFDVKESEINGYLHSKMPDFYFESLTFAEKISHVRKIKTLYSYDFYDLKPVLGDSELGIYLNQDIYNFYFGFNDYIKYLKQVFDYASKIGISKLYFRFHPRENFDIRRKIANYFDDYDFVIWGLEGNLNQVIEEYGIGQALGFHSSALLELKYKKMKVTFLYFLVEEKLEGNMLSVLNEINRI